MTETNGTIFINYRKDDSSWNSLALYNELQKYFSKEQLFKDFNTILPGDDFVVSIQNALTKCDVLLVIIGPNWLNMKDEKGQRRLDDPDDFVRLEISTALNRNVQVIPVLIDNTPMPKADDLPENMRVLYRRQYVEIDNTRFEDDVRKLAMAIRKVLPGKIEPDVPVVKEVHEIPRPKIREEVTSINARPSNQMVLAILSVIFCFPLGIVSILAANKVDALWLNGRETEAIAESKKARSWAMYAFIASAIVYIIYLMNLSTEY